MLPQYTYEDYLQWEGRWELIDGIPYAMAPMPVPEHQRIAGHLAAEFREALRAAKCSCKVYLPIDYVLSDQTVFNPDVFIVCSAITKKFLDFPPALVVEILSDSTAGKDRHVKYPKYEAEDIPYYLIVDVEIKAVEIYQLTKDRYQLQFLNPDLPYEFLLSDCRVAVRFADVWE